MSAKKKLTRLEVVRRRNAKASKLARTRSAAPLWEEATQHDRRALGLIDRARTLQTENADSEEILTDLQDAIGQIYQARATRNAASDIENGAGGL